MSRQGIGGGGMQPYKRKGRVGPPGSAIHAMQQGKPAGLPNRASLAQALARLARNPRGTGGNPVRRKVVADNGTGGVAYPQVAKRGKRRLAQALRK